MQENKIITSAVCPQCGAPLKVIDEKGTLQCEYCNIVSLDGRHNFTHISRDFESELELSLESAQTLLINGFYEKAFSAYSNLVETFGKDYRVWQGSAASITANFTDYAVSAGDFIQAEKFYDTARSTKGFSEECEFAAVYKKWRAEVIARNERIQAYEIKSAKQRRIKNVVFAASIPVFLLVYWFVCINYMAGVPLSNWILDMLNYILAPAIYSTALGIAAVITKFRSVSICLNVMTIGCVGIFFAATAMLKDSFKSFNIFWFAGTLILALLIYTVSTLIGRILGIFAIERSRNRSLP